MATIAQPSKNITMPKSTLPQHTLDAIRQKALAGQAMMTPTAEKNAIYNSIVAQNNGYSSGNYQKGYGIGDANNVSGGFNQNNNPNSVKSEIDRVNSVIANRTKYGIKDNGQFTNYLDQLNTQYKPYQTQTDNINNAQNAYTGQKQQNAQQQQGYRDSYEQSQARQDATKWSNATIEDIAKKYGFNYSRDYAKQQAEAEAQALRNANADAQRRNESNKKTGLTAIDNNLMDMAEGLDRNYFQKGLAQQQNQVNTGLNAGIASDQDLRLAMNRQAEMGSSYRDANLGRMKINENFSLDDIRLAEQMGLIDQQALAREDSLYNDRLQQGFGNLMTEREMANARDQQEWSKMFSEVGRLDGLDQQMWGRSQADIERAIQQQRYLTQDGQWQTQFDYTAGQDAIQNGQWDKQFNYNAGRDKVGDQQWNKQFDYGVSQDAIQNGQWDKQFNYGKQQDAIQNNQWSQQFNQGVREFNTDVQWREHQFNNMSASEKANLAQNASQFGEDMAWRMFELESNNSLAKGQYEAELGAYGSGNFSLGTGLGALSQKYESSGNPATIARTKGDLGGASYGSYQLTTTSGNAQKFANQYGGSLKGLQAGSSAFDKAWKLEAGRNPEKFAQAQHNYIKATHYDPVVKANPWITKYPKAVQDAIWSTSVQHGVGGAKKILSKVARVGMTPEAMITAIYNERARNGGKAYFPSSPPNIRSSVVSRFQREKADALRMLKG